MPRGPANRLIEARQPRVERGATRRAVSHTTSVGAKSEVMIGGRAWRVNGPRADVAQTAERLTCNQQVAGSTPAVGSRRGTVTAEEPAHGRRSASRGSSSVGRASAFQAERRGFDSRLPLSWSESPCAFAQVAQSAEHVLGKDEVGGSIPLLGLSRNRERQTVRARCEPQSRAERYPSGQREQTVNLPAYAFGGSNPPLSIFSSEASASGSNDASR